MSTACRECLAIAQDLHDAYQEILSDPELREAWLAGRRLVGGNEDDVLHAESAFAKARASGPSKMGAARQRLTRHQLMTGHLLRNVFKQK